MAFYSETKTARAACIGTIMPWSGGISNIPDGWIICDGSNKEAKDFPLLTLAIGESYNDGAPSITGSFPNYGGNVKLPELNGRIMMDLEVDYFTPGSGPSSAIEDGPKASTLVTPFIGENQENVAQISFTDVRTDVVFNIPASERTGYQGKISGNAFIPGEGSKTLYIAPRKLGRNHIKFHNHSGSIGTLKNDTPTQPGKGVIPYEDFWFTLYFGQDDDEGGPNGDRWYFGWSDASANISGSGGSVAPGIIIGQETVLTPGSDYSGYNPDANNTQALWPSSSSPYLYDGTNSGPQGRVLAKVRTEAPPVNYKPQTVFRSPLTNVNFLNNVVPNGRLGGNTTNAINNVGPGGNTLNIPSTLRNYHVDDNGLIETTALPRGTFLSNPGYNFNTNETLDRIVPHDHADFDVIYDGSRLKPQRSVIANASIPPNTVIDNTPNVGALQIDFNITQPQVTALYIIRAY